MKFLNFLIYNNILENRFDTYGRLQKNKMHVKNLIHCNALFELIFLNFFQYKIVNEESHKFDHRNILECNLVPQKKLSLLYLKFLKI